MIYLKSPLCLVLFEVFHAKNVQFYMIINLFDKRNFNHSDAPIRQNAFLSDVVLLMPKISQTKIPSQPWTHYHMNKSRLDRRDFGIHSPWRCLNYGAPPSERLPNPRCAQTTFGAFPAVSRRNRNKSRLNDAGLAGAHAHLSGNLCTLGTKIDLEAIKDINHQNIQS